MSAADQAVFLFAVLRHQPVDKMGHPAIREWTSKSPDRVYQWAVEGHPECTAYLRIKAGKSRAGRGEYKRSKPFFCMKFDTAQHALMILLGTGDMLQMTKDKQLIMEGRAGVRRHDRRIYDDRGRPGLLIS